MAKEDTKDTFKNKIATNNSGCCCENKNFSENYENVKSYEPIANLGLGCGIPTDFANIKKGDTVFDLGSGAGNDCFVVRRIVGDSGRVIGVDCAKEMIGLSRQNCGNLGYNNVVFVLAEIEKLPFADNAADVVISNCVMNLVPDKKKAYSEIFRVLKPGGHFSISDIIIYGELPEKIRNATSKNTACIGGAMSKDEYLQVVENAGFKNIQIQKERTVNIDDGELLLYVSYENLEEFHSSGAGIGSINIYAEKL